MQTISDLASPRYQLPFEKLPRGVVRFPAHIVDAMRQQRAKFAPDIFTEEYARKSLERQTLTWYYDGLPVAFRPLPDGIEVLGVGWEETKNYGLASLDSSVVVVRP